jgi:hypothetical protein
MSNETGEIKVSVVRRVIYLYSVQAEVKEGEFIIAQMIMKKKLRERISEDGRVVMEKTWYQGMGGTKIEGGKYVDVIEVSVKAYEDQGMGQ